METTITVKNVCLKQGTTKKGRAYTLTKILATDGQYYCTFSQLQEVHQGMKLKLDAKASDREGYNDIIKILDYNAGKIAESQTTSRGEEPARAPMTPADAEEPETYLTIEKRIVKRLHRAKEIVEAEYKDIDYALYVPLVVEAFHQLYAETQTIRIQRYKESNISKVAK